MERPEDFEEREEPPAEATAEIAETVGEHHEDPSREDRYAGGDVAEAVSGAEELPDI